MPASCAFIPGSRGQVDKRLRTGGSRTPIRTFKVWLRAKFRQAPRAHVSPDSENRPSQLRFSKGLFDPIEG
ncbi:hypothetical protein GA0115254_117280 [Streptomyces sp. Ncost-T10-10d]|nr:hypothetical protein GA0115254_117280 [Streptomyces sp. Ncost-T10-10d]